MTTTDPSRSLRDLARSEPGRVALVDEDRSLTFAELDRLVDRFARGLEGAAVRPGSRVVLVLENSFRFVASYLGAVRAGAVAVPLNPLAPRPARLDAIADAAPRVLVCEPGVVHAPEGWAEQRAPMDGTVLLSGPVPPVDDAAADGDGLVAIIYTSGTTGPSKGVMLTAANMAAIARAGCDLLALREEDHVGVISPLFHLYGLREIDAALLAGATLVVCPGLTFPARVLARLHDQLVTGISGVPGAFRLMVERYRPQLSRLAGHLRYLSLGTDAASAELLTSLGEALPATRLMVTYGLTELSRACHRDVPSPDDRPGSVGRPYPRVELEVLDDQGRPVAPGTPGRVALRSAMVSPGYWRRPNLTAQVMSPRGGLLAPDVGRVDQEGFLYLLGRVDDMVNTGGQKVGPEEVEAVLKRHPSVRDAAVTGVSDPAGILGQVLKAWIVPVEGASPNEDELRQHCALYLEPHKVPRMVEVRSRLPKSVLGKTSRGLVGRPAAGPAPTTVGAPREEG